MSEKKDKNFVVVYSGQEEKKEPPSKAQQFAITLAALLGGHVESEEGDLLWSEETGRT